MGILSDDVFLQHQAFLGSGFASLKEVESLVESGLTLVVASTDVQVEIDLLGSYTANLTRVSIDATAQLLSLATNALERHITERSGQTFNDYLFTNGLKVSQDFADLSAVLGATIAPQNIG